MTQGNINKIDTTLRESITLLSSLASVAENLVKSMHINPTAFDSVFTHKGPMFRGLDVRASTNYYSFILFRMYD